MKQCKMFFVALVLLAGMGLLAAETPQNPRKKPLPLEEFYKNFEKVPTEQDMGANFAKRVYLGTAGNKERYNSLTLGWGACGVLWGKPVAIVYIRENRFSYAYFDAEPIYTLSWYPKQHLKTLINVFGGKSGKDTDKEQLSGFTPVETPDGGVSYLEAEKVVVCRKLMHQPVPKEFLPKELGAHLNRDGLIHVQFTGEVLSVWRHK
ncbi:MAG: flavin reductase [Victivallales bacterium]|nr:flavin reductase [Victivallales bacterium]